MDTIKNILRENHILTGLSINKINIGFTNKIYDLGNMYILKICAESSNEEKFAKESFLYDNLWGSIPVPKLLVYDNSKLLIDKDYMIYEKIQGETLYNTWHLYTDKERENIVMQLANILKKINNYTFDSAKQVMKIDMNRKWFTHKVISLYELLERIYNNNIIDKRFYNRISIFIDKNKHVLTQQKMGLTYYDLHFDNVLVASKNVIGLIDLERTDYLSIDYALDTIRRLTRKPHLYASKKTEKYIKTDDYKNIYYQFQRYYPELFDFKFLDIRLDLYSLEYDMKLLCKFPNNKGLKNRILSLLDSYE